MNIAVLGATGNVGKPLVELLAKQGHAVRASTRSADKPLPSGVTRVSASNLDELLRGAQKLFLLAPPVGGLDVEERAIDAAKRAGIAHVVKLSSIGAAGEKPQGLGIHHREMEKKLEATGMAWTMLRPGFFMSNALPRLVQLRETGAVRNAYGDGVMYPIAPADIAAVAALALTEGGHESKRYVLTGEVGLTVPQEVAIMARAIGKEPKVIDLSPDEGAADARKRGAPEDVVAMLRDLYVNVRENRVAEHDDTARRLLGRPLMTFETWFAAAKA
ncbi:MAG TPA: NmrA family NAD(P)-binding protein [Polyangiaceae bacterium]|jgi:uncharacterized protein YbjT (DUF2867 family)